MLYWFPDHWTLNGKGTKSNNRFSERDKQHLGMIYPKKSEPVLVDVKSKNNIDIAKVFNSYSDLRRLKEADIVQIGRMIGAEGVDEDNWKFTNANIVFDKIMENDLLKHKQN